MKKDEKIRQDASARDVTPAPAKRSLGLRAFDVFLYPVVTNLGVFTVSVWATYMSTKKPSINPGAFEKVMQARGTWLEQQFAKVGITGKRAEEFRIVAFSFLDGSVLAPVVKLFEDRRTDIARSIDRNFSSQPVDESEYASEPKQSWASVLGGRALTAGIVVPTALTLNKIKPKAWLGNNLNDVLFNNPGKKLAAWVDGQEGVKGAIRSLPGLKNLQVSELAKVSLFEAFYTSVCTAGLYFTSRGIARMQENWKADRPLNYSASFSNAPALTQELDEAPKATVETTRAAHARLSDTELQRA